MQAAQEKITLRDFQEFVNRPENSDRLFELVNGEIIEVSPGRTWNSEVGYKLALAVHPFCVEHGIPCHFSGGDGAYNVQGHVVAPDFAFKRTPMSKEYPDPVMPEWVVEVISPTDKAEDIRDKREIYQSAGILLWEMYPKSERIDVYSPGEPMHTVTTDGTLDGGKVLPGFSLPARELFGV